MTSRVFSRREKILFLIFALLLIGYAYYSFVWKPSVNTISDCESQIADIETHIITETARLAQQNRMEAEIEKYRAAGENARELPLFNNQQRIISELNAVLAGSESYSISFSAADFENDIAMHPIRISFSAASYRSARNIVTELQNTAYICKISALSLSASKGASTVDIAAGPVQAQLMVTFFEYLSNSAAV